MVSFPWVSLVFPGGHYPGFYSDLGLGLECAVHDSGCPLGYPWHFQCDQIQAETIEEAIESVRV